MTNARKTNYVYVKPCYTFTMKQLYNMQDRTGVINDPQSKPAIGPSGPGRIGGQYFLTWRLSVRPEKYYSTKTIITLCNVILGMVGRHESSMIHMASNKVTPMIDTFLKSRF